MVWNKVTLLSKILALALFVALPFIGFWYGIQYGAAIQAISDSASGQGTTQGSSGTAYYTNIAAWPVYPRDDVGFSIAYPFDFQGNDIYPVGPSENWRAGAAPGERGNVVLEVEIPRALEPQTNFIDARLHVAYGAASAAVANCLTPDASGELGIATSSIAINGVPFTVFHSAGAALGNYYETTSYRALRGGRCWALEYTIHSSQIANYPESYGLQPFNKAYLTSILDRIVGTFRFTK